MSKPIIFSGIKPTGNLNIGGYLGALRQWVELQNSGKYEMYFFVVDLHALTTETNAERLRKRTMELAAEFIAAGIDPTKSHIAIQSHVPEHAELAWIFNCVTPVAELYRMTQFKDKSQKQEKNVNAGLLTYPTLMAADILLYKATVIPVGEDQVQHVELARDIARWFNNRYGNYFPEPKHLLTKTPRVMGLLEPTKKMSKSDDSPGNVIDIHDEPEVIESKLKKAVTATEGGGSAPGVKNLLSLLLEFGDKKRYDEFVAAEKSRTIRYGDLKSELAKAISGHFAEFRKKRSELLGDETKLNEILKKGATEARQVASKTMEEVRKMVGIR